MNGTAAEKISLPISEPTLEKRATRRTVGRVVQSPIKLTQD